MNVSDVDSIIHILKSISFWGLAFLVLIILPLYTIGWSAVFKLLGTNTKQTDILIIIIIISIVVSLTLLKFGITQDQKLTNEASKVKNYFLTTNQEYVPVEDLYNDKLIPDSSTYIDDLVDRFPNYFAHGWHENKKDLLLIDSISLNQLTKNINKLVPVLYSQLKWILKKDSILTFEYIENEIDYRMSYRVLEALIIKYPDEFIESTKLDSHGRWFGRIKRIK